MNGYEQIPIINAIYNKKLADLNPVELVAAVGTMANIQPKFINPFAKEEVKKPVFYHENNTITQFVRNFDKDLQKFNIDIQKYDPEYRESEIDTKVTNHLYEWAALNAENDDSVENWKKLYDRNIGKSIKNEGSVFKEITMTADLLKQMKNPYYLKAYKTL